MRHVSKTHRVALDWLFDRINLDPKIQIKYIDTKNQFADMLAKGNFTRDEWNHLLCLFNISHFNSTVCSKVMSRERNKNQAKKESQRSRGQWWVLLQGLPQLYHLRRQKARGRKAMEVRVPGVRKLRKMIERGNPLSTVTQVMSQCTTTSNLLKGPHSARCPGWDDDKAWSSQVWKADELMDGRTVKPLSPLGQGHTSSNQVSLMRRPSTLFWKKKKLMTERWNPLSALKEDQGHSKSSLETTKQNWNCR